MLDTDRVQKKLRSRDGVLFLCCGVLATCLLGCGGGGSGQKTVPVTGTVTLAGEAVPYGSLLFVPVTPGPSAQANLKPDGTFRVGTYRVDDGMIPGEYQVSITGQMSVPDDSAGTPDADAPPPKVDSVPDKYGNASTSGLTATISETDKNELKFELSR